MSLRNVQAAIDIVSHEQQKKTGLLETIIAGILLIFPIEGAFGPFETYFFVKGSQNFHGAIYEPPTSYVINNVEHMISLFVLLCLSLMNWRAMFREARLMLPLLALLAWGFASAIWSIDPNNTLHRALHVAEHAVFATYLVQRFKWRELIAFLTRCYGIILIMSLVMVLLFPELGYSFLNGYTDAWRGVFTEKNTLGSVAVMGVLTSGYSLLVAANHRGFAAFVCAGQLLLLVMSRSATSTLSLLVALGAMVVAFGVFVHQRPVVRLFTLMSMLVGLLAGIILFNFDNYSITEIMGRSNNLTGRTAIWHYVLSVIELKPWLGYGYGFWNTPSETKLNVWMALDWPAPHAPSEWMDVTLQTGIIGLCLEVFCLTLSLMRAARFSFVLEDGKALFCGMSLVVLCVRSFSETTLTDPAIGGWIWLVIAFLMLAHMAKETTSLPSHRVAPVTSYRVTPVREQKS
jgi:exopolysaccharide production protein ExoQ